MNDRLFVLLDAYLENRLTDVEAGELRELLRISLDARRLYWEYVEQDALLDDVLGEVRGRDLALFDVSDSVESPVIADGPPNSSAVNKAGDRRWLRWAGALAGLATAALVVFWAFRRPDAAVPDVLKHDEQRTAVDTLLRIVSLQGKLEAVGEDRAVKSLRAGDQVPMGATVRSDADGAKAVFEILGERIDLGANTTVRLVKDDGRSAKLLVANGNVRVDGSGVEEANPFVVVTPHIEIRSGNAIAEFAVNSKGTRVAVAEGAVQLLRRSDQTRLDLDEGHWVYASAGDDPMVPQRPQHESPEEIFKARVDHVALAPDCKTLAIYTRDKVEFWDLATRTHLKTLDPKQKRLTALGFSPDGKWVVVGGRSPFAQVWDWRNDRVVKIFESRPENDQAYGPVFSRDGSKLFCMVRVNYFVGATGWNTKDWAEVRVPIAKGLVKSLLPIPGTDQFAAGGGEGELVLWDSVAERQIDAIRLGEAAILKLAASADGRWLAQTGPDGTGVWDLPGKQVRWHFESNGTMAFDRDSSVLAIASIGYIDFWHLETGKLLSTIRTGNDQMQWLHFDREGRIIYALSGASHRLVAWKVPMGQTH